MKVSKIILSTFFNLTLILFPITISLTDLGNNFIDATPVGGNDWTVVVQKEERRQQKGLAGPPRLNTLQMDTLRRWYESTQNDSIFAVGMYPYGVAFDGTNIWVSNNGSNNVTKLRVSNGTCNQGTSLRHEKYLVTT